MRCVLFVRGVTAGAERVAAPKQETTFETGRLSISNCMGQLMGVLGVAVIDFGLGDVGY